MAINKGGIKGRPKTGGRKKGSRIKRSLDIVERMEAMGMDPIARLIAICDRTVPCCQCEGVGDLPLLRYYFITNVPQAERFRDDPAAAALERIQCPHCGGTGREPVPLQLEVKILAELMTYEFPKKAAVQVGAAAGTSGEMVFRWQA